MNLEASNSSTGTPQEPSAPSGVSSEGGGSHAVRSKLSEAEFARLITQVRPALTIVASAVLGDRVEADDIVQEASVIGLASLDRFTPGTSFEGWMAQIVRNVARNALRKRTRNPARASGGDALLNHAAGAHKAGGSPPLSADGSIPNPAHFDADVRRALQSLDETSRVCLLLRTVGEMSYAQIAAITELNENTAMSHVFRSRRTMREFLTSPNGRTDQGGTR
ncbi:MAG: sigma-70 family RNA polymerase sigma factor [Phycisphaerae bacterium]|nr:sigma-70 family RNA polymerase sigma factor [Phycisphaerae bacterium]